MKKELCVKMVIYKNSRTSNSRAVILNLCYTINLKEGDYKSCYRMIILDFGI